MVSHPRHRIEKDRIENYIGHPDPRTPKASELLLRSFAYKQEAAAELKAHRHERSQGITEEFNRLIKLAHTYEERARRMAEKELGDAEERAFTDEFGAASPGHMTGCSTSRCRPLKTWPQREEAYKTRLKDLKAVTERNLKRWSVKAREASRDDLAEPQWDCVLRALHHFIKGYQTPNTPKSR